MLQDQGRTEMATDLIERRARLRPNDFISNYDAWDRFWQLGRETKTDFYLARARKLLTAEIEEQYPDDAMDMESYDADLSIDGWDVREALTQTRQLADTYERRSGPMRNEVAFAVGWYYLKLGKLKDAESWFQKIPPERPGRKLATMLLTEAHGTSALRSALKKLFPLTTPPYRYEAVVRLARCGMFNDARQLLSRLKRRNGDDDPVGTEFAEGGLALYEGRLSQATAMLEKSFIERQQFPHNSWTWHTADLLASAYAQEGRFDKAIQTLRPFEDKHTLDVEASFHLFQLYEKAHDTQNAQKVREDLLQRLAYADANDPILVQLHRQTTLRSSL